MKRTLLLTGGICWFLFAVGFGFFLVEYVRQGSGLQFFPGQVSSGSVLIGLIHVIGLMLAAGISFAIGAGLCARAIVREQAPRE